MEQQYSLSNIRNVALLSHTGAGKTSAAEAVLFTAGAISRMGKVEEGNTTSDYDPDEVRRRISINLSLLPFQWRNHKINIIDTPGYPDFAGEVKAAIRVTEGAVVFLDATSGVEVGTMQVWQYCNDARLPRLIFVNKMDRENADFLRTADTAKSSLGPRCIPIQMTIGAHTSFQGVIDLVMMKAYTGSPTKESEVPAALQAEAKSLREKVVEAVAEADDKLLEKYLGGQELTLEELKTGLREGTKNGKIIPVLAGSALQNIGMNMLVDACVDYLPSPTEREVVATGGQKITPALEGPLTALVFKTTADPYVGKLTYFRVYVGAIESNSQAYNCTRDASERIGQLFQMRGKTQEPVPQVRAGDIGAVAKLNVTSTGDTLCRQDKPVKLPPIEFPKPIYDQAVYPKTKLDLDKLGSALTRLAEEDPTLKVRRELSTGETIASGLGETQLAVAAEKMLRKFGVSVEMQSPKVPYRETITAITKVEYRHKKQSGGHGQFGHVYIELDPLPRGSSVEFEERVVGGSVPRNYIPAVEKGVMEAVQEGVMAGYPVVDVKAVLYDGSYHAVDSSDMAFKIAGAGAVKKGLAQANPILLEPIVKLKVTVPSDLTGDIIGDLNTKRARVLGMSPEGDLNVIEAEVPQSEVQRYAMDLKSMTQGRGLFTMEFSHYEEVPAHIAQKIIAQRQAEKEKAEKP